MKPSTQSSHLQILFEKALDLPIKERHAFIRRLHEEDPKMAREVERLIHAAGSGADVHPLFHFDDEQTGAINHERAFQDHEEISTPVGRGRVLRLVSDAQSIGHTEVYQVELIADQRRVALKVLRAETSARDLHRRFRVEAWSYAKLDHPGIASMLGAGAARGASGISHAAIVMVFVDGVTLDRWAENNKPVPDVALMIADIARSVHFAHLRGIVHRDLKPQNIMIDAENRARVLDLGVAKLTDDQEAGIGRSLMSMGEAVVGTPRYMAPEQFTPTKRAVDLRADVYALGCILYELITGVSPVDVDGLSTVETADAKREATVQEPRVHGIPRDLIRCAVHACSARAADRYGSCQDFAVDIERAVKGIPLIERPPGPARRFGLLIRRHPRISAVIILAIILGICAMWVYVGLQRQVAQERDRAISRFDETKSFANWVIFDLDRMLSAMPGSADTRRQLIDRASTTLDALTADPETDDDLLMNIIDARIRLGDVLSKELGNQPRGDEQLQLGLALLDRLESPDSPHAQVRRAWINLYRTYTMAMEYGTPLEDINLETISIFEKFEPQVGTHAPYWRWRADAEWKGTRRLLDRQADASEILALGRASVTHADRALELDPGDPFNQSESANTRFWVALAKFELHQPDALAALDEAIQAAKALIDIDHREGVSFLARGLDLRGEMLFAANDYRGAIDTMLQATALHDAAVEQDPRNKSIFRRAEISRANLAAAYLKLAELGDPGAAEHGLEHIQIAIESLNHRIARGWFDEPEGDYRGEYAAIEQRLLDEADASDAAANGP